MKDKEVIETLNDMKAVFGERGHSQYSLYAINRAIAAIEKQEEKMKNNKFKYKVSVGSTEGFFNIYQARNGRIYIQMGNLFTPLTLEQVRDLKIDCYSLLDFDYDDFKKAYGL